MKDIQPETMGAQMTFSTKIQERLNEARGRGNGIFDFSRLGLTRLPEELRAYAASIHDLNLEENDIAEIEPNILGEYSNLRNLTLGRNRFTRFPESLSSPSLRRLNLDGNGIRDLHFGQSDLPLLRSLSIRFNGMERVGSDIKQLAGLETLDLSGNIVMMLPAEICLLERLRELFLSDNPDLLPPPAINRMTSLRLLDLRNNNLITLPPKLGRLPESIELRLEGNIFDESLQATDSRRTCCHTSGRRTIPDRYSCNSQSTGH